MVMGRVHIIEIVPLKSLLGISMPQNHFILLDILNLSVFRYTLFVVGVIIFNSLNESRCT